MDREPVISIKQMRAIAAVANTQGFRAAAEELRTGQSTLSRTVRDAENSIGATLFRRGWSGAEPTAAGDLVVQSCSRGLSAIAEASARLAATSGDAPKLSANLTWEQLEVVSAVAASGGASAAAKRLGISQPQVSRTLSAAAFACRQPLFRRGSTGLRPLPAVERLVILRERLLAEILPLPGAVRKLSDQVTARVAVGMTPFSEQELVAEVFGTLLRLHPQIRVSAVTGSYAMLVEALRQDELDLVIGALREDPGLGLATMPLYEERILVVARHDHACAARSVGIEDLARSSWIVAPHGTPIRGYFEELFLQSGVVPPVQTCEIVTFDLAEQMIVRTDSLALLMYSDRKVRLLRGELAMVPVDLPGNRRMVGLTMLAGKQLSRAELAFVERLKECVSVAVLPCS
jgi:LysR family transcriptional regulator, regulator for genes of the gallate degradation pathway